MQSKFLKELQIPKVLNAVALVECGVHDSSLYTILGRKVRDENRLNDWSLGKIITLTENNQIVTFRLNFVECRGIRYLFWNISSVNYNKQMVLDYFNKYFPEKKQLNIYEFVTQTLGFSDNKLNIINPKDYQIVNDNDHYCKLLNRLSPNIIGYVEIDPFIGVIEQIKKFSRERGDKMERTVLRSNKQYLIRRLFDGELIELTIYFISYRSPHNNAIKYVLEWYLSGNSGNYNKIKNGLHAILPNAIDTNIMNIHLLNLR